MRIFFSWNNICTKLVPANAFLSTYYIWHWQLYYHGFFFAVESIGWNAIYFVQIKKYHLFGFCLLRHGQVEISFNFKKPWYHIPSIFASHKKHLKFREKLKAIHLQFGLKKKKKKRPSVSNKSSMTSFYLHHKTLALWKQTLWQMYF